MQRSFFVPSIVILAAAAAAGCLQFTQPSEAKPSAESLCATAANAFYCQTTYAPQSSTLNSYGYKGYCMVGTGSGKIGYSGVIGDGAITYVYPTSDQAWQEGCGANSWSSRGICHSVVRCTHE